jgi:pimeloyl-ACP methyl ester carboxylesterase
MRQPRPRNTALCLALLFLAACGRDAEDGLALHVRGSGSPTILFEAGLGDWSESWDPIVKQAGKLSRVVTYDRAGLGQSPPASQSRTAEHIAAELREALRRHHIEPPYLLVTHSAGAWYGLTFAARNPDEVRGILMIDPTPVRFFQEVDRLLTPEQRRNLTLEEEEYARSASPGRNAEWAARDASALEAARAAVPSGLAVTILSAGRLQPGEPRRLKQWWLAEHRRWASQWPRGRQLTIRAGHYVHHEQPEAVMARLRELLAETRR